MLIILNIIVEIANNGKKAIDVIKKRAYDLVLMDIQMPVMSGNEACGIIQKIEQFDLPENL